MMSINNNDDSLIRNLKGELKKSPKRVKMFVVISTGH